MTSGPKWVLTLSLDNRNATLALLNRALDTPPHQFFIRQLIKIELRTNKNTYIEKTIERKDWST